MKIQLNKFKKFLKIIILSSVVVFSFLMSCESAYKFDLPEAGSIEDTELPKANFSYIPDAENFRILKFTNLSSESTKYLWDFGDSESQDNKLENYFKRRFFEYLDSKGYDSLTKNQDLLKVASKNADSIKYQAEIDKIYAALENADYTVSNIEKAVKNLKDPVYLFPKEATYDVKLTSSDENGASKDTIIKVVLEDKFVPIPVTIVNGDFNDSQNDWKFASFTGGNINPFNSSSDGSFTNYDGTDNGAKTKGAKWTKATSAGAYLSSNTRYAYQAITVSPTEADRIVKYILEYEYAIKTPAEQAGVAPDGNRIYSEILNNHFEDGAEAVKEENRVSQFIAKEVKGKTTHTKVEQQFTTNATGKMAIMFYAVTDVDVYIDNVKVYAVTED